MTEYGLLIKGIGSFYEVRSDCGETVYYVCSANGIALDMGELCKTVNLLLCGKGGGRGTLAQGSAPAHRGLAESVEQLRRYCAQTLYLKSS